MYDVFISYCSKNKSVADEIYKLLCAEGFNCFVDSVELRETDWAGQLYEAVAASRAFIIIVSKEMNESNEVLKEVLLATKHSHFIFPFIIDDVKLESRFEYHLAPFQWIKGVIPPQNLVYESLISRVRDALQGTLKDGNINFGKMELVGQSLSPRAEFIGREEEISSIGEILSEGDETVFLTGMGGIGKSEVARAFAKSKRDIYKTVVMISYQGDILDMISDDRTLAIRGCSRGGVNGGQSESAEDYYVRKLEALRSVVDKETLLIIDNFDTEEDEHLQDIIDLRCDKIFTTRVNFEEMGYPTVFINTMDPENELLPLMEKLDHKYIKDEDRDKALQIIKVLDNHTYAVSLTASQMRAGHISPSKMLDMLINEGITYKTKSTFSRTAGEKKSATDYIRMLFDFSALSEREVQLMRYLACTPLDGIDIDLFMELAEIDDFEELRHLMTLNWVQEDADNNICRIHMLVRELIKDELGLSAEDCITYITNLSERLNRCSGWNNSYETNLSLEAPILAVMKTFPEPPVKYTFVFDEFGGFCWVMNHFDESERQTHYLYNEIVKEYGEVSEQAGLLALRMAAVYHNQNDHVNDKPWYEKAKDIMLQMGVRNCTTVNAMFKVARSDMLAGNYDLAEKEFIEAIELCDEIISNNDQTLRRIGRTECEQAQIEKSFCEGSLAIIRGGKGEYEKAEEVLKPLPEKVSRDKITVVSALYFLMALGVLYTKMGETEKAIESLNQSLENSRSHHADNKDTILILELLGDALVSGERPLEAAPYYVEALNKAESKFPGNVKWIEELTEKYEMSRKGETFVIPYRYLPL